MNQFRVLTAIVGLLVSSQGLFAQHEGHGMHGGGGGNASSMNDSGAGELQKAMIVQGTREQAAQLHSWMKSTEGAQAELEDLRKQLESRNGTDFSVHFRSIETNVQKSGGGHDEFVTSLSMEQQKWLKSEIQKVGKANDELKRQLQDLASEFNQSAVDVERASKKATKLDKALKHLTSEQHNLGTNMGLL